MCPPDHNLDRFIFVKHTIVNIMITIERCQPWRNIIMIIILTSKCIGRKTEARGGNGEMPAAARGDGMIGGGTPGDDDGDDDD